MLHINDNYYKELASRVSDLLDEESFFSGSVEFPVQNIDCEFVATIIIYKERSIERENNGFIITDLVPVWWEFNTSQDCEELLNDFDFQLLKDIICPF